MKTIFIISISILLFSVFNSCENKKYYKVLGYTQGTTFAITYEGARNYETEINNLLHHFDLSLSTYNDSSIISRINRNEKNVILDNLFIQFFTKSREVYEKSAGYFDITIAPVVNAYGFGFSKKADVDSAMIDSLLDFVGMDKVDLKNGNITKFDQRIMLDGNAIAQGQSVDFIASFLQNEGVSNYLVEIGGEIRAQGMNDRGEKWRVGIDKPIENSDEMSRSLQAILKLNDKSLATSGNYRKFYEKGGIKYGHSINPKTGYPAMQSILSATIIADDCMTADAYATTCMVIGLEKSIKLISTMGNMEAYIIYSNVDDGTYEVYMTDGMTNLIEEFK